jgi:hypothetical protein
MYQYSLNIGPYYDVSYYFDSDCRFVFIDKKEIYSVRVIDKEYKEHWYKTNRCDLSGTVTITNKSQDYQAFQPFYVNVYLISTTVSRRNLNDSLRTINLNIKNVLQALNKDNCANQLDSSNKKRQIECSEALRFTLLYRDLLCTSNQVENNQCDSLSKASTSLYDDLVAPGDSFSRIFKVLVDASEFEHLAYENHYILSKIKIKQAEFKNRNCNMFCSLISWVNDVLLRSLFGKTLYVNTDSERVFYSLDYAPKVYKCNSSELCTNKQEGKS